MVKRVVNTEMVAHLWAHQSQQDACNAGRSASFYGRVFYSYSTPVAMLHAVGPKKAPRTVALITSDGYSMTTKSKHLNAVRHALRGMVSAVFTVPYVGAYGGRAPSFRDGVGSELVPKMHAANLAHLVGEYESLRGQYSRMRSMYCSSADDVANRLNEPAGHAIEYAKAFRLKVPQFATLDDARVIWAKYQARQARAADPVEQAKRAAARESAERRKAEREAAERADRALKQEAALDKWRKGTLAGASGWRLTDEHGGALLRLTSDGQTIQTSWGAECPADDARRVWPIIQRSRAMAEPYKAVGLAGFQLGSFALNSIDSAGTLRAGCHTIHWPELENCARLLGLLS